VPESLDDADFIARLEKYGANQVRTMLLSGGFPIAYNLAVIGWLSKKDQEAERLREATEAERCITLFAPARNALRFFSARRNTSMASSRI
jgi:hypothetical protein